MVLSGQSPDYACWDNDLPIFLYQAFNRIEERDKELAKIRDGTMTAKKKPRATKQTKNEAFENYLKIFYDRPRVKVFVKSMLVTIASINKKLFVMCHRILENVPDPKIHVNDRTII